LRLRTELWEKLEEKRGGKGSVNGFIETVLESFVGLDEMPTAPPPQKPPARKVPTQEPETPAAPVPPEIPGVKKASEVRYKCRVSDCTFTALSPSANCPNHTGKLVLA
jgi:hypothetical protein